MEQSRINTRNVANQLRGSLLYVVHYTRSTYRHCSQCRMFIEVYSKPANFEEK